MQNANKPMIDSHELADLLCIPVRKASSIIHEVNKDLESKGAYVLVCRPPKAPRKAVMEKLSIDQ